MKCKLYWVACKVNEPLRDSCTLLASQCSAYFDKHQKVKVHCLHLNIGVGRFRILGGGEPRFRILGGGANDAASISF